MKRKVLTFENKDNPSKNLLVSITPQLQTVVFSNHDSNFGYTSSFTLKFETLEQIIKELNIM